MINILVTGGKGQLGQCINAIASNVPQLNFIFVDKQELDISNNLAVSNYFDTHTIDWCINCAAYTAVDKAEENEQLAYSINVLGAKNLALACQMNEVKLIHISTDFVFDGRSNIPYKETDQVNPQGVYAHTKLKGEQAVINNCTAHFIVRTSWLYSEFGHNFMITMLRLASERDEIGVVGDQMGSPTYAVDLADVIIKMILSDQTNYGVFHYSNKGQISWFEFAKNIFDLTKSQIELKIIQTKDYNTLAQRPAYSVLDTSKISKEFNLIIPFWKDSLIRALARVE